MQHSRATFAETMTWMVGRSFARDYFAMRKIKRTPTLEAMRKIRELAPPEQE